MHSALPLAVLGLAASVSAYTHDNDDEFSISARDHQAQEVGDSSTYRNRLLGGLQARDLDEFSELLARELEIEELTARDLEDLEARDPLFRGVFRGAKKMFRGRKGSGGKKGAQAAAEGGQAVQSRDVEDIEELFTRSLESEGVSIRDLEELEARDPNFKKFLRGVGKVIGFGRRDEEGLHARDFETEQDIVARELADLSPRELQSLMARARGGGRGAAAPRPAAKPAARPAAKAPAKPQQRQQKDPQRWGNRFDRGVGAMQASADMLSAGHAIVNGRRDLGDMEDADIWARSEFEWDEEY